MADTKTSTPPPDNKDKKGNFIQRNKTTFIIVGVIVGLIVIFIFYRANANTSQAGTSATGANNVPGTAPTTISGPPGPAGPVGPRGVRGRTGKRGKRGERGKPAPKRHPRKLNNPGGIHTPEPPRKHIPTEHMSTRNAGMPINPTHNTIPHENQQAVRSAAAHR